MNWPKVFPALIIPVLVVLLLAPALQAEPETAIEQSVFVAIPAEAADDLDSLSLKPARLIDYESFLWLELGEVDFAVLSGSDVPFRVDVNAGTVQVSTFRFDPLVEEVPDLPVSMTDRKLGAGYRLVQLVGPTKDEWLFQLSDNGLKILQYYPHHVYLTWGTAFEARSIEEYEFVRWQGAFHPAFKISSDLSDRTGTIENVDIVFFNDGNIEGTLDALVELGVIIINAFPCQPDRMFYDAIVRMDETAIEDVARLDTVLWLGYSSPEPGFEDEMSSQIVAGNHPGGIPAPGYFPYLDSLGYDGSGVIWSTIDSGVDYAHPDLNTRIVGGYTYPGAPSGAGPGDDCASGGHGTHVSGIIGGDATAGFSDADGFLYGLGIAPGVGFFAQNSLCGSSWPPAGGWQEHSKQAVIGSATGGNNSWTTGEGTQHGYQASERTHDFMVRDGNFDTPTTDEPFIEVFSAGNSGSSGLTAPKEAENLLVTASSRNYRAGAIDSISGFSSRDRPLMGGGCRRLPHQVKQLPQRGVLGLPLIAPRQFLARTNYSWCSGTSMAAPQVSGAIALATEWWRSFNQGADPSPAMAKALVVNGAVDMGAADIPNASEGWGRINVTNIISPSAATVYRDQVDLFNNTGEQFQLLLGIADPTKPLKVTLAWSDSPGAIGANPSLVNDLNLSVDNGGTIYLGNQFSAGWSVTGGSADGINNLENVYIQNPSSSVIITIDAVNIAGDGLPYNGDPTDQDFALVCYNCSAYPDFSLSATPSSSAICAPEDAVYDVEVGSIMGYNDPVTLSASGHPAGTGASFTINPVTPPGTSTLNVTNTASGAAGSYSIDIVGIGTTSTHTSTVDLELFRDSPGAPSLLAPADEETNVILLPEFIWLPAGIDVVTYLIEVATDFAFTDVVFSSLVNETRSPRGEPVHSTTEYFWRVQAASPCGSGPWSSTFSFSTAYIPPILLVDDDDNNPDVRDYYTDALDILVGVGIYDIWDTENSDDEPDAVTLSAYELVIWFTGDEFGGFSGPGAAGETALSTWLDSGGCFLISSQDYQFDRGLTDFMQNYLGVLEVSDDVDHTMVTGQGSVFGSLGSFGLVYPFTNYSDLVESR